jgi:hypothetical protein
MSRKSATSSRVRAPEPVARLRERFRRHPVATLPDLRRTLRASTRSVYRALNAAGYHSSYSHAGAYYTLEGVPAFSPDGLWFSGGAAFSLQGTLRSTIQHLVLTSDAGRTHPELQALLRLRVHDTLCDLTKAKVIARELAGAGGIYVYLAPEPSAQAAQLARRRALLALAEGPSAAKRLDARELVEVLLEVIHHPRASPTLIGAQLRGRGHVISDDQVAAIFAQHGLEKKTARSRSKSSRG